MPLSITNTNHISQQEIFTLAKCNLSNEIIAVQMNAEGGAKIVSLSKDDVTCWQLFLRFFGLGKLAKMQVHIKDVAANLNQFDWAVGAALNPVTAHYQAYLKTCSFANKALYYKWDETLFNNVSCATVEKRIEFAQYRGFELLNRHEVAKSLKWNPAMQIKHLQTLLRKQFHSTRIRIEDEHYQSMTGETNASQDLLNRARVYVEQHIVDRVVVQPVPVPVPSPQRKKQGACSSSCATRS